MPELQAEKLAMKGLSEMSRFMQYVDPGIGSGCWLWKGNRNRLDYGMFQFRGRNRGAHQVSYVLFMGEVPAGKIVHHRCEVPACVNPDHLEALTHREHILLHGGHVAKYMTQTTCKNGHPLSGDNLWVDPKWGYRRCRACIRASWLRWRARTPHKGLQRGERNHNAKLTTDQVLAIRASYVPGKVGYKTLAKQFDVAPDNILKIVRRQAWTHV
jgi:hypothetical protein